MSRPPRHESADSYVLVVPWVGESSHSRIAEAILEQVKVKTGKDDQGFAGAGAGGAGGAVAAGLGATTVFGAGGMGMRFGKT